MLGFAGLESGDSFADLLFFPFLGEFGFSFSATCALSSSGEDEVGGAGGDGGGWVREEVERQVRLDC